MIKNNSRHSAEAPVKEDRAERILSLGETLAFWRGLEKAALPPLFKLALKIQLMTAQHLGSIVSAKWSDIDWDAGCWTISQAKFRPASPHRIPLSKVCLSLLSELKTVSGHSEWLFPSSAGDTPMDITTINTLLKENLPCFKNVEPFISHDLRRTAAVQMMRLGVAELIIGKLLNLQGETTSVRHDFYTEKKEALEKWAEAIELWNRSYQAIVNLNEDWRSGLRADENGFYFQRSDI